MPGNDGGRQAVLDATYEKGRFTTVKKRLFFTVLWSLYLFGKNGGADGLVSFEK